MKQYQDLKKQFNIFSKKSKLKASIFLLVLFSIPFLFSYAQTAEEIQNKINQKNTDIERLEQEIKTYQAELNTLGKQKSSLNGSIKELDLTRKKLIADMNLTESKIEQANLKAQSLGSDIHTKEDSISLNKEAIKSGIQKMNELDAAYISTSMLSGKSFTEMWNDVDNLMTIHERMRESIISLKEVKGELEDTRSETLKIKEKLTELKSKLEDDKKIVEDNTKQKNQLLSQTKNNEANYQKLLKARQTLKNNFEREMRDYESQLKFILDPTTLPSGGVLSWPLDNIYVTQLFGKTVAAKRLYASGSHSGVDFRASVGTPVKAMADGIVAGVGDTDTTCAGASFGKWVFIEYNNGLASAYGHLSLTKATVGQKVSRGDVVAYSGNTGHTTGPHLHVTVYASKAAEVKTLPSKSCPGKTLTQPLAATNAYLDPMYYLPAYKQ